MRALPLAFLNKQSAILTTVIGLPLTVGPESFGGARRRPGCKSGLGKGSEEGSVASGSGSRPGDDHRRGSGTCAPQPRQLEALPPKYSTARLKRRPLAPCL